MDNSENAELNYCYNCMTRMDSGQTVCPACGHDNCHRQNPENALPEGTILAGKYLVGKVLGQGGFGITYLGFDTALKIKVAIKEYFPTGVGVRLPHSIRVTALSSKEKAEGFSKGCDEFQAEAQRLAAIESPNIVKVRDYFRENGTAYIVMNYLEGNTLTKEVAACGGKMPWRRVVDLFTPLILELDNLHKAHLIHRDIKPDNIKVYKAKDGTERLVLLDFGAARSFVSSEVTGTYSAVVSHGYAPIEQYSPKSRQGPYTDIYALCATMYAVLTGALPADATDRMLGVAEILPITETGVDMPEKVEKAIFHGLEVRSENRPQSMRELYAELNEKEPEISIPAAAAEKPAPAPRKEEKREEVRRPIGESKPQKKANWLLPVLLAVLLAAGFFLYRGIHQNQLNIAGTQTAESGKSTQTALELASQLTADGQSTQTAQAEKTHQAAETQRAGETREALHVEQTGTAWNITAAAEDQQTQTQEALEASATQAERENRMEQTVQVETRRALGTQEAVNSDQTATQAFVNEMQTRTAEAKRTALAEQTMIAMEQTQEAIENAQTEIAETREAFNIIATQNAWQQTQESFRQAQTEIAGTQNAFNATQTKLAEPTATQTATMTATATATPTPTVTKTPKPSATPKPAVKVGDIITLGHYEQDGNKNNGAEEIEWQVLAVEDGRALVISKYGLNTKRYNESYTSVTWETSIMRKWLNGEFYNSVFSNEEKGQIRQVRMKNPDNAIYKTKGGNDTTDRIFLLSIDETDQYFTNDEARQCEPTTYAKNNGAYVNEDLNTAWWWLRSPGVGGGYTANVDSVGIVNGLGVTVYFSSAVVRPAFWLNLDVGAEIFFSTVTAATTMPIVTNTPKPSATPAPSATPKPAVKVGDIITLGHYEQDGNKNNGTEAIEWQVLTVEDSRALVVSKYGLDTKRYNETYTNVTWKTSILRTWLNGEFYNSAFSNEEKGQIQQVRVKNPDNAKYRTKGGNDTTDRIFLLSIDETDQYFANDEARQCKPTTYAKNNGAYVNKDLNTAWWWLRSPGVGGGYTANVDSVGIVNGLGVTVYFSSAVVRPALWLNL